VLLNSNETKEKILTEFLNICSFDGWSKEALVKAITNCGIDAKFLPLIFENGLLDLAEFYIESYNQKSAKKISHIENFHSQKIRDKIRLSLYARFEAEEHNRVALQRLINFYLNPKNFTSFETGPRPMAQGLKDCYKIADFMWKNIGDQSTDFNFYTKRLTLAKIILRSVFVFVKDDSDNFTRTKNFIDLEIEKVMKFEKYKARVKKISHSAKKAACHVFLHEDGALKSPKEVIKNLPFFRLFW
jgi:ubiquinone biosynthesis protein COQ9